MGKSDSEQDIWGWLARHVLKNVVPVRCIVTIANLDISMGLLAGVDELGLACRSIV
jgi:hypothetical protein